MTVDLTLACDTLRIGDTDYRVARPHDFGVVILGPTPDSQLSDHRRADYLHQLLLTAGNREAFMQLIHAEKLVVCKNVESSDLTYRRVRGKSSGGKLSQAEYYHHDGCSCPTKPELVEIRLPHQPVQRNIATAIARFADVVPAMLNALPARLRNDSLHDWIEQFSLPKTHWPPTETWDQIQGQVTRLVRKDLTAEACREYFRQVDRLARAYVLPWEMGESRLMLNNHADLSETMQHRRSLQQPKTADQQNGSLVKRWTAEEYPGC